MDEWHDVMTAPPSADYHDGWNAALLRVAEIIKAPNTTGRVRPDSGIVGPVHFNGFCSAECPFFRSTGERPAECEKLKAALDYYDGWLAICDDLVSPEIVAKNQAEYRRSNSPRKTEPDSVVEEKL
jgi:hypothetical protein